METYRPEEMDVHCVDCKRDTTGYPMNWIIQHKNGRCGECEDAYLRAELAEVTGEVEALYDRKQVIQGQLAEARTLLERVAVLFRSGADALPLLAEDLGIAACIDEWLEEGE